MPRGDLAILEGLVASLQERPGVVGIAVVGSFARGEVRSGSDIDVVVLTDVGNPYHVEGFEYAGRAAEVLFVREDTIRSWLADPHQRAQAIATWAGGRVLHDTGRRLAVLLAQIEEQHRRGPAPMTAEDGEYARFELTHLRQLVEEAAMPTSQSTCRLLIAAAIRAATEALLRDAQRWPVGWRTTLPALRSLDAEAADLAERALTEPVATAVNAARALIDRALGVLGGPLRPGP